MEAKRVEIAGMGRAFFLTEYMLCSCVCTSFWQSSCKYLSAWAMYFLLLGDKCGRSVPVCSRGGYKKLCFSLMEPGTQAALMANYMLVQALARQGLGDCYLCNSIVEFIRTYDQQITIAATRRDLHVGELG